MVSPDGRQGMLDHAEQFAAANIPFIFDPGQGMPMFNGEDLVRFMDQATWVTLNDYEAQLMQERTGLSPHEMAERVQALIITRGGEGSHIYTAQNRRIEIPAAKTRRHGGSHRMRRCLPRRPDLWPAARPGLGDHRPDRRAHGRHQDRGHGTQNHSFTRDEFEARFKESFGYAL